MTIRRLAVSIALALALAAPTLAQSGASTPELTPDRRTLAWPVDPASAHRLLITGPDGQADARDFAAGAPVTLAGGWSDGGHRWQLLALAAGDDALDNGRGADADAAPAQATALAAGGFAVADGMVATGETAAGPVPEDDDQDEPGPPRAIRDQVIADDLIVQGSICTGFDCINNEPFGFATLKLKENNLRLLFEDTSGAGFPTRDWQITANDSAAGGLDYLGFEDITGGTRPFWVEGGARANALVVTGGRIGMGIAAPATDIHYLDGDTPTVRLDQAGGGFTPQTWDVAGNEANFFIRDVTGGSLLSFRIQPGAPTSTITANASGNVGLGLWDGDAGAKLDVYRNTGDQPLLRVRTGALLAEATTQLELGATGNLRVNGTISQLSSRAAKTNFVAVDLDGVLDRVAQLPLTVWNYLHQSESVRHLGPTAEDFHAAFGLGERPTEIAPGDLAGVALAAVQALNHQVAERDRQIEDLEQRLARLEARLGDDAGQR